MNKLTYTFMMAAIVLTLSMTAGCRNRPAKATTGENKTHEQPQPIRGSAAPDKSNDTELKALLAETVDKFVQRVYNDPQTGDSMSYNLFIPEGYEKNKKYPLVLFIADASTAKKDVKVPLTQGYGGVIWASAKDQAKYPSFVLVPQYTTTAVNDNFGRGGNDHTALRVCCRTI